MFPPPPPRPGAPTRALVVFARAPRLGEVKTRLAAALGPGEALRIYRTMAGGVCGALAGIADCTRVVAYTPSDAEPELRAWLGDGWQYAAQAPGSLGDRMAAAIEARGAAGAQRVVVVGTDCPALDAAVVDAAFAALDEADVVFGPAADGGYYLVGVREPQRALFEQVPWSSAETLRASLARAAATGLRVALLAELHDVDTADDWAAWCSRDGELAP